MCDNARVPRRCVPGDRNMREVLRPPKPYSTFLRSVPMTATVDDVRPGTDFENACCNCRLQTWLTATFPSSGKHSYQDGFRQVAPARLTSQGVLLCPTRGLDPELDTRHEAEGLAKNCVSIATYCIHCKTSGSRRNRCERSTTSSAIRSQHYLHWVSHACFQPAACSARVV